MKIAILCQMEKPHRAGKLGGGIQAVERFHADLLGELGHDVTFITTMDSDSNLFIDRPTVNLHKLTSTSEEAYEAEGEITKSQKGKLNKQKTAEIRNAFIELSPDVIINHSFSSSHVKLMADLSKQTPVLCVIHNTPDTASDMSMFAKLQGYRELMLNGSTLVCVSKFQRDLWRKLVHRRYASGSSHFAFIQQAGEIDRIFDVVCYASAVDEKAMMSGQNNGHFMVIGRPESDKNIGKLLEGFTYLANPPRTKVYMAFGGKLDDYEYYLDHIKPHLAEIEDAHPGRVTLHCNQSRASMLADLSTATGLFVTCPVESFGIAPLEAAVYAVPSLVFCKRDKDGNLRHSCFDSLGEKYFKPVVLERSKADYARNLLEGIEEIGTVSPATRELIRAHVLEHHSRARRAQELQQALSVTIDRYKNVEKKSNPINNLLSF